MATDLAIFLATSGHSGVDRLARNLVPALAQRGYNIDLLKVRNHGPHLDTIPDGVRVIELGTRHVYPSLFKVAHYLRQAKPASLFCDKDRVNHTALLARAMAGVSTYLTLSMGTTVSIDLAHRGILHRIKTRLSMGLLYSLADNVIVTSEGVAEDMAHYTGLKRSLINVVPCPIVPAWVFDADFETPDHPWFSDGGPPIIMGLGELGSRKDFATLIRAFARIRPEFPCRLMILGRGRDRERLVAIAHELGVADALALPGFVDAPYAYLAQASLFAFTSLWEGLGFALIEALAVGVPSVSTDCPSGPREILADGKYGPLVPVGDHEALAAAMLATLRNPLPKSTLQAAARPYEIENATSAYVAALNLPPQGSRR
ncbi:MAG: glycosyltransferase [Methylococcaceae bacterium]|jgi:glycosyltransferase involved in cell wall biosynthesis